MITCGTSVFTRWGFAAAVLASSVAVAHGLDVKLDIAATPTSVTRSSAALRTYADYEFTLTRLERSRFGKFKFKGTVTVDGLPAGSTAAPTLFAARGATCTLAAGALECAVPGELKDGTQTLAFTVTLQTPSAGTGITVSGKATFVENYYFSQLTNTASASTALTEPSPDSVSTFVPASAVATTLFSGSNTRNGVVGAIPIVETKAGSINDPFTTTVIVPAASPATTATVTERELAASCSANPRCFESKLAIPGNFGFLTIILRRDRTTLMNWGVLGDDGRYSGQSAIEQAIVKYFPDDDPTNPDKFIIVLNCSVVPGGVPTAKNPCIESRTAYPKEGSAMTPVPPGLEGDWEFVIRALDNGRFQN